MNSPVKYWVACSGGVDSVVLARLMCMTSENIGLLHCNFQLRGEDSDEDERFVVELARELSIPFRVRVFNVEKHIQINGGNTQLAARELRYAWFDEIATETNAKICLAHHQDDQIETFFLQLFRGAKVRGLACMPKVKTPYVRPLLNKSKAELVALATRNEWDWREDRTNQQIDYKRNLYRNVLFAMLKKANVDLALIPKLIEDYQQLKAILDRIELTKTNSYGANEIIIDEWNRLPVIAKRNELDRFGLSVFPVEEVDRLAKGVSGAKLESSNRSVWKYQDKLAFLEGALSQKSYNLETVKRKEVKLSAKCWAVDRDMVAGEVTLRDWKSTDRISPFGMKGSKSVANYLKDKKVPPYYRHIVKVLVDDKKRVVMIPGFVIDHRFRITEQTKECLICNSYD